MPKNRYAPFEGEEFVVIYWLQWCCMFIMGATDLILAAKHKPLIKIFNDCERWSVRNPWLLRLKGKTVIYRYEIIHASGKSGFMKIAGVTSRNPVKENDQSTFCDMATISYASHMESTESISTVPRLCIAAWRVGIIGKINQGKI